MIKKLFEFLDVKYVQEDINKILSSEHSLNNKKENF